MLRNLDFKLIILIVGRLLQVGIALLAIKLATKVLDVTEMGNYYLIISIAGFFGFILVGPIGQYINRKTHQWYKDKKLINILYVYNYYVLFISCLSFISIYILSYVNVLNNINISYLSIFFVLYIISHTWNQTLIPMLNMLEHRVSFVVFTVLSQLLFLVFSYIYINVFGKEGIYWFLGQTTGFAIVTVMAMYYFRKKIQNNFKLVDSHKMINKKNINSIFKFSIPLAIGALFFWIQTQSYPLIISKYKGVDFLGNFGVGMAVAFAIASAFESIVMQYIYPSMYKSMNSVNFSETMSSIINLILPIYFLLTVFVSFFGIYINAILVNIKYFDSYIFVIFGVWIAFFRMSSNIISNIAHYKMQTAKLVFPNFIGAILSAVGVIFAIQTINYKFYVPMALLISGVVSFLIMYRAVNKLIHINLNFKNFFFVLFYSIPFLISMLFYKYAHDFLYSMSIVLIFGIYFLFILYLIIKKEQIIE